MSKSETTVPPNRELTPDEKLSMEKLDQFMGRRGKVVWYQNNGEWRPAWGFADEGGNDE